LLTRSINRVDLHKSEVVQMKPEIELETYMPSEAEEITKVTQSTVRNWRRAGYLPKYEGHARYTIADLLIQFAMQAMVARGMTLEAAGPLSREAARAIFYSLICKEDAYSKTLKAAYAAKCGDLSALGLSEEEEAYLPTFELIEAVVEHFRLENIETPTWFIIWANGETEFYFDADISEEKFFGNMSSDPYSEGPITLFFLTAMARMFLARLPRPAIKLAGEK
jgi:hypothetical protein